MSRASLFFLVILLLIVGGVVVLSMIDTEVPPVRVEKAMLNEAAAQ
jgi:hypothetical protein